MNAEKTVPAVTMTVTEAREFRTAYEAEVRKLSRMSLAGLKRAYADALAARGTQSLYGGPQRKDELINAILGLTHPVEKLNETTHILYHQDSPGWSACEFCHPHGGVGCDCALGRTA